MLEISFSSPLPSRYQSRINLKKVEVHWYQAQGEGKVQLGFSMVGLKVKCISNAPYLEESDDGRLVEGQYARALISLTIGKVYLVLEERDNYIKIIDDTEEDYYFPKSMFEFVEE